jgi:cysteine-rich repeat protein
MLKLFLLATLTTSSLVACNDQYGTSENPITEQGDCTLTQGYWKNHPAQWPVSSVTLGSVTYSKAEALDIFAQPVSGNGLVSLAHQLLATKLNVASGATNTVVNEITAADAAIGALVVPPVGTGYLASAATAGLAQALDDYNTGATGPGHCDGVGKPECACGDGVIHAPEECDDGNTVNGDGCNSVCRIEGLQ